MAETTKKTKEPVLALEQLVPDPQNARTITDDAMQGLGYSLAEFGDISGITWNLKTGTLVCGHQRVQQLRDKWGEKLRLDEGVGLVTPSGDVFPVRIVEWDEQKHRAAQLAANNPAVQGEYDLTTAAGQLKRLEEEAPQLYDPLRLSRIWQAGDRKEPTEADEAGPPDMELQPYESYDYVIVLARNTQDWEWLCEKLGLQRVNASPVGAKKIGLGRAIEVGRLRELIDK